MLNGEGMTNYYEAHEVIGNKIKLKKGFKDNLKDRTRFTNRLTVLINHYMVFIMILINLPLNRICGLILLINLENG